MDYPYKRQTHYNVSNDFWFLPTDLFTSVQNNEKLSKIVRKSPILHYLEEISPKDKFKYLLLILLMVLFIYRINLKWSIWLGLMVGIFGVYYLNEQNAVQLNSDASQLWAVLKSPLLNKTKYFITDPPLIRWVNDVSEFKPFNVLEFNKMITTLDQFLKLTHEIKIGVNQCKENLDLIRDLKINALNQFHSLVYTLGKEVVAADLRAKYNHYLEQLGYLLNQRHSDLIRICKLYYTMKPADITSHFAVTGMDEPTSFDQKFEGHYGFFNT